MIENELNRYVNELITTLNLILHEMEFNRRFSLLLAISCKVNHLHCLIDEFFINHQSS